jgi:hypothetical protein
MPAPTLTRPAQAAATPNGASSAKSTQAAPPMIPFTRAARKKSRLIGQIGPVQLGAGLQQIAPLQVPANGYLRNLILDVTLTETGTNAATVAFQNDAPFNVLQQISLAAANGDSLINPIDGFTLAMVNKYGVFGSQLQDPLYDPTFTKVTGSGATGGSAHFQLKVPVEIDPRDALGALANMAANQSFLLQMFANTSGQVYSTPPTNPVNLTITVTAEYWAAPSGTNPQGIPQQTTPRCNNVVSLLQTQTPPIVASTDQTIQLVNVGNTVRWIMLILRTAGGVRDEADWPNVMNLLVNNDLWEYKTKNNWRREMAFNYELFGGVQAVPTVNCLDNGVYVLTSFTNDGASGGAVASSSANRDLMLVTGSGTALNIEAQNWGASAGSLLVLTNALRIPDPTSFYAPFGI